MLEGDLSNTVYGIRPFLAFFKQVLYYIFQTPKLDS